MYEAEIYYINKEGEFGHEKGLISVFNNGIIYFYEFESYESELKCAIDKKEEKTVFINSETGMICFWVLKPSSYSEDKAKERLEMFIKRELEYFESTYKRLDRIYQCFLEKENKDESQDRLS